MGADVGVSKKLGNADLIISLKISLKPFPEVIQLYGIFISQDVIV